jgi:predicted extracellular nuclease
MKVANTLRLLVAATLLTGTMINTAEASITGVKITEWMYSPVATTTGEFVEFTNFGPTAIDFTGWSYDDSSRTADSESLSAFGTVASGESVIFTEGTAADFRTKWNLSASVKIIGGNTNNLGRSDEINLYNASNTLVDRLTYNDQGTGTVKGPRTQGVSGEALNLTAIGANNASLWKLATVGDSEGAYASVGGDIGSPGKTAFAPQTTVPVPAAAWLLGSGLLGLVGISRRKD